MQLRFEHVSYTYDAQAARRLQKQQKKLLRQGIQPKQSMLIKQSTQRKQDVQTKQGEALNFQTLSFQAHDSQAHTHAQQKHNSENVSWALRDVSFCIHEGECVGIAGHTGSGKSTLLQHMNGLFQPTCGSVLFNGENIAQKSQRKRALASVGMVFQYPERQLFAATVYDDVSFGPKNLGLEPSEVEERVTWALRAVGVTERDVYHKSPFELSGGMQRRVAIAGVLAMRPRVLVLDEPSAGLDPQAKTLVLAFVQNLHAQGITIVMASHNMDDLANLCTNMLVLSHGEIALQGTPEQVFSQGSVIRELGLSLPNAQRVANNLRARGVALPQKLYANPSALARELANIYTCSASHATHLAHVAAANTATCGAANMNSTTTPQAPPQTPPQTPPRTAPQTPPQQ